MPRLTLLHNARILTQAADLTVDSMVINRSRILAIGNHLEKDPDFSGARKINLRGRTVTPGLVDAHTHFYYFALSLGRVQLDGLTSLDACLKRIREFATPLPKGTWIVGDGYAPDRFTKRIEPDRLMLDAVTAGRPAFLFSKDQHTAWVNSRALEICGIAAATPDPDGGKIERFADGTPSGILREGPAYMPVYARIPSPPHSEIKRRYREALQIAYHRGVTGVHSFDGPDALPFFSELAEANRLGLRINYYPGAKMLPALLRSKTYYGSGTEFLRIAGIKIFADGSLGSQSALCFHKYLGSKNNFGIETTPTKEIARLAKEASRLGLPCAVHAIGDRAVASVLDALSGAPRLSFGARHRIEHLQLIRRSDIARLLKHDIVASMQPSHCPSDIPLIRKYWGKRGADAFVFRTLIDRGVDLAFGSDVPIEPLNPIHGIAAAVRRARQGSRDTFEPKQKISAAEALFRFTVGPAIAAGQEHCRGYLLPGYPADYVVLDRDITTAPATKLYDIQPLATVIDGRTVWQSSGLRI